MIFALLWFSVVGFAKEIKIEVESVHHEVEVHYQSTYLSQQTYRLIPQEALEGIDPQSGLSLAQLLASEKNGIPSLSHTWLEARRNIRYSWDGKRYQSSDSEVISWLPYNQPIQMESRKQPGASYSLESTAKYMDTAASAPVYELLAASQRARVDGPGIGWKEASDHHPIVNRPLLGVIPRRIAAEKIRQEVRHVASTLESIAYRPGLSVQRGKFPPLPVSEDTFFAIQTRVRRMDRLSYSVVRGLQRFDLDAPTGTSNCSATTVDLLAGGQSRYGEVGYLDFGVNRGYSASALVYSFYAKHGPTYLAKPTVREQENFEVKSIQARLEGTKTTAVCSCTSIVTESNREACQVSLGSVGKYEYSAPCTQVCGPRGIGLPYILANCAILKVDE